jgi:amino acid adenylation domain-containing protein
MDIHSVAYNMPGFITVPSGFTKSDISGVFQKLISRHDNFRTSFEIVDDFPVQRIHSELTFTIEEIQTTKSELAELQSQFAAPFDLSIAPLLRVAYLEVSDGEDMLLVDMHHIISDGRSHEILSEEFEAILSGKELPTLQLQYKDYSEWQNSEAQQDRIKEQADYWITKLSGELPVLELPTDYSRPKMQEFAGASVTFSLTQEETRIIGDLSKEAGLTLYMSMLSIFTILLSKLSGQEDIIVGSPIAARRHADLDNVVGMFVNTLAMRNEVCGETVLKDYLQTIKTNTLDAYENQEYQFEDLVEQVVIDRDTSRNPIFDVMFNLLEGVTSSLELAESDELIHIPGVSKFDLSLTVLDLGSALALTLEYSTKLFSPATIDRFIVYLRELIHSISVNLDQALKELNILSQKEKHQLLYEFNDTATEYPKDKCIHELFEDQVEKTPDSVAIVFGDKVFTYKELNVRSGQLANYILEKGYTNSGIVGLMLNRTENLLISVLGILKSGNIYMPIDLTMPLSRIDYLIKDSGLEILITEGNIPIGLHFSGDQIQVNKLRFNAEQKKDFVPRKNIPGNAYLLYTSGSTGTPKGVLVRHESVVNLLCFLHLKYRFLTNEVHMLKTPYVFDVSVSELYGWILSGSQLSILKTGLEKDPIEIKNSILKYQVNYVNFVPSMFTAFVQILDKNGTSELLSLRYVFLAGEALQSSQVIKFQELFPGIKIENLYGPTETTVYSSTYGLELGLQKKSIPIGTPISNYRVYILGKTDLLLPIGVKGELCISGVGLAQGYLNNPELTSDRFIMHPFKVGELLYRTGDLARWLPNGNIEFLGRIDHQVKIRGYRIELGEIENVLLKHSGVKEGIVLAREDKGGDKYLCAYVVVHKQAKDTDQQLRTYLTGLLPDYMVPPHILILDNLPLTANGKIDRKVLPEPEYKAGSNYVAASGYFGQTVPPFSVK